MAKRIRTVGFILSLGLLPASPPASALPHLHKDVPDLSGAPVVPVVVFGKNSRRDAETFAVEEKLDAGDLRRTHAASGLIRCGNAHGAGQLTLTDDVVTTAAHVFFDENGAPRAKTCSFAIELNGKPVVMPINLASVVAGSKDPYAIAAVHDWAVARLEHPIEGVAPYALADAAKPNEAIEFVARGHMDWGGGKRLGFEKCMMRDQLSVGEEGTREFSFDCETGDGASGGAVIMGSGKPHIGAILVGWRSNNPFRAVPFSPTHYNFAVTIEGAFRKAVLSAAQAAPTTVSAAK